MAVFFGDKGLVGAYIGDKPVKKLMLGADEVWSASQDISLRVVHPACIMDYSAAVPESYAGTGQTWHNLVPDSAEPDFWLGTDDTIINDPIWISDHNGEFLFNGNMYLQQKAQSAFVRRMHCRDSSPWTVTLALYLRGGDFAFFSTRAVGSGSQGLLIAFFGSLMNRQFRAWVYQANGNWGGRIMESNAGFASDNYYIVSVSWNPVTRAAIFKPYGGTVEYHTDSNFSLNLDSSQLLTFAADPNGNNSLGGGIAFGAKLTQVAVFNAALNETEMDAVHAAVLARRAA